MNVSGKSDRQAGEIAPHHVQRVVAGEVLNAVPAALAQVQGAAEGAVRGGQADVRRGHRASLGARPVRPP